MTSPLCFSSEASRTLVALLAVTTQVEAVKRIIEQSDRPQSDQMTAEMRDAMEATTLRLQEALTELAGPIWGELPEEVRAVCRLAGM